MGQGKMMNERPKPQTAWKKKHGDVLRRNGSGLPIRLVLQSIQIDRKPTHFREEIS